MKKVLLCALVAYWIWSATYAVWGAPLLQSSPVKITSPAEGAVVRGTVPIVGTAVDPQFWKYEVYYGPDPNTGDRWTFIGTVHEKQVVEGLLETWVTMGLPDGGYALRLRVVNRTGNYSDVIVRGILVANAAPTETLVPTATPHPTMTSTPAATPTFMIPDSPLAQPSATPTLARPTRSILPEALDVGAWRGSLCLGAQLMIGALIVLGIVFLIRRFM